jgi:hypothetical protein
MTEVLDFDAAKHGRREARVVEGRAVNAAAVEGLEEMLELAKKGEIVGFAMVPMWHDNTASYLILGRYGGYAMLGAMNVAMTHVVDANLMSDDDA